MARDRSLDEFLSTDDEESDETPGERVDAPEEEVEASGEGIDPPGGAADGEGERSPPDATPAESTFEWSPSGAECAACGASVARRWRDDGTLVCADCKEW